MYNSLITTVKSCTACIFTVNSSAPASQRRSQVKWLTPVKPEKNACLASALFQCSLIRSDAADAAAADHKATPPPPMKNARRAAAARHKNTQRRRRPPVRRCTALAYAFIATTDLSYKTATAASVYRLRDFRRATHP